MLSGLLVSWNHVRLYAWLLLITNCLNFSEFPGNTGPIFQFMHNEDQFILHFASTSSSHFLIMFVYNKNEVEGQSTKWFTFLTDLVKH